jgi:hypothetical protein
MLWVVSEISIQRIFDAELMSYSDKVWDILSGYVNSQDNRYRSRENSRTVHEVPLHDLKVGGLVCNYHVQGKINPCLFTKQSILNIM